MRTRTITLILMTLLLFPAVRAYSISSLLLTVYSDGYVKVEYEILSPEYSSQIELSLPEHYENLIVEDGDGNPLDFRLENGSLLVYPGEAGVIRVSYYTPDLTSKEGILWKLNLSTNHSFTVVFPENAVVVDLSDVPLEIAGNSITMPPGNQSVSYTLEGVTSGDYEGKTSYIPVLAVLGLLGSLSYLLWKMKRGKKPPSREEYMERLNNLDLTEDEKRALIYLFDRGGRASQAEVREAIGLPKTTAWRMFRRLERKGLVKVLKGSKENWVELRF
ncbi:hypothetical protein A3L12_05360 [Thermococcus sp. P6]|uniref:helix-turn-helix transcriptional regulator n=1 Tax=Thermococcus sp. P6 TaxID=122420 RepID=UPI000B5A084C|nr:helix-turn-helix domain-containing protein [Thermococcus sp. P6]ASJ10764.1 hypothetical protein A3L12_05360 [Thermococcus sp. P6]